MRTNSATLSLRLADEPERVPNAGTQGLVKARCYHLQGKDKPSLFLDVLAWSKFCQDDLAACHKGDTIIVSGKLGLEEWTTREGEKRQTWNLRAETVDPSGHDRGAPHQRKPEPATPAPSDDDDAIPF